MHLLCGEPLKRALDAHSAVSAAIAERARVEVGKGNVRKFDALWSGSLTSAASFGVPDTGVTPFEWRIGLIEQIRRITSLPILFDAENGGPIDKLPFTIHRLEPLGVSAIVIEDRVGPKSNSFATAPRDSLADVGAFVRILDCAASARSRETTVIVGRLEGLIFGASPAEVAGRARAIESTGVGALLIHSKSKCSAEVLEAADRYRSAGGNLPLIAIPTTYSSVTEPELEAGGFSLVVYANQLLRAALRQMTQVAQSILVEGSTAHVEPALLPIKETISYFSAPTNEVDDLYGVGGRIRKATI